MKTLLRHTDSNLYVQSPDHWTDNVQLALDFRFIDLALQFAKTWELREVELALVFDNPPHITLVSLDKCKA